jgi:hypothetical protein
MKKPSTRPHSPHSLAHLPRATDTTHSPRPLYKRGGRASGVYLALRHSATAQRPGECSDPVPKTGRGRKPGTTTLTTTSNAKECEE